MQTEEVRLWELYVTGAAVAAPHQPEGGNAS